MVQQISPDMPWFLADTALLSCVCQWHHHAHPIAYPQPKVVIKIIIGWQIFWVDNIAKGNSYKPCIIIICVLINLDSPTKVNKQLWSGYIFIYHWDCLLLIHNCSSCLAVYLEIIAFPLTEVSQFWINKLHKSITFMFSV